jgi:inosose dehydratase
MSKLADQVRVANAPVSYGAFEITVGIHPNVPAPEVVLDAIAAAGYAGVDLGPYGYFGEGPALVESLHSRGLELSGGFLEIPFSIPDEHDQGMRELDRLLDVLDLFSEQDLKPVPTLSDAVRESDRQKYPGRSAHDRSYGLPDDQWESFTAAIQRSADRCRERGYVPVLHHHTGSWIEAEWEVEKVLELTDMPIALDSGHLTLGWGDPVRALRAWGDRIRHVHLKDAHTTVLRKLMDEGAEMGGIWESSAFCALGDGDADLDGVVRALEEIDYSGWLIVEQDLVPDAPDAVERAIADQRRNREFLRERGV